eukprot:scaffold47_cov334-Pavlova_lutheri.AAC.4
MPAPANDGPGRRPPTGSVDPSPSSLSEGSWNGRASDASDGGVADPRGRSVPDEDEGLSFSKGERGEARWMPAVASVPSLPAGRGVTRKGGRIAWQGRRAWDPPSERHGVASSFRGGSNANHEEVAVPDAVPGAGERDSADGPRGRNEQGSSGLERRALCECCRVHRRARAPGIPANCVWLWRDRPGAFRSCGWLDAIGSLVLEGRGSEEARRIQRLRWATEVPGVLPLLAAETGTSRLEPTCQRRRRTPQSILRFRSRACVRSTAVHPVSECTQGRICSVPWRLFLGRMEAARPWVSGSQGWVVWAVSSPRSAHREFRWKRCRCHDPSDPSGWILGRPERLTRWFSGERDRCSIVDRSRFGTALPKLAIRRII